MSSGVPGFSVLFTNRPNPEEGSSEQINGFENSGSSVRLTSGSVITNQSQTASLDVSEEIETVSEIIKRVLSQRDSSCYDRCSEECGYVDGSCGCGAFGAFFCRSWDMLFSGGVNETGKNIRLLAERLESEYGPLVLLKAQMLCGLSLEEMLRRNHKPTDYEKHLLERACKRARNVIASKMASYRSPSSNDSYVQCIEILSQIPGMPELILQRIGCKDGDVVLSLNLKVFGEGDYCLRLNEEDMLKRYLNPNWFFCSGPPDASVLYQIFMEVVSVLNDLCQQGRIWVQDQEVEALVMFMFAVRGFSFCEISADHILVSELGRASIRRLQDGAHQEQDLERGGADVGAIRDASSLVKIHVKRLITRLVSGSCDIPIDLTIPEQHRMLYTNDPRVRDLLFGSPQATPL
ncbi:MAG: hypothetical protein RR796_00635 [Victivallaceae bacterium]